MHSSRKTTERNTIFQLQIFIVSKSIFSHSLICFTLVWLVRVLFFSFSHFMWRQIVSNVFILRNRSENESKRWRMNRHSVIFTPESKYDNNEIEWNQNERTRHIETDEFILYFYSLNETRNTNRIEWINCIATKPWKK